MEIPKEAWIILYVFNEPSDWIGSFPSDHYQQYYTERRNGLPHHFDSYKEAREFADSECLVSHIIVPVAGEQAIKFSTEQERLCNIPDVVGTLPCEHENIVSGHSPFVPCYCKDCGQDV